MSFIYCSSTINEWTKLVNSTDLKVLNILFIFRAAIEQYLNFSLDLYKLRFRLYQQMHRSLTSI